MGDKNRVEGEGSYTGSKNYNERTRKFVESGKVDEAAQKAKPESEQEAAKMKEAERTGRAHSRGEDPGTANRSPDQGGGR